MNKISHLALGGLSYKLRLLKPLGPPIRYSIESTNYCNFKCRFCPQSDPAHKHSRARGFLTTENLKIFLDRVKEVKPGTRTISVCLDGEPLLNEAFPDLIRMIIDEGFFPSFSSNGKLLTPETLDRIAAAGDFLVAVDFSHDPKCFDGVRGREGDHEIVLRNLQNLIGLTRRNNGIKVELVDISGYSGVSPQVSIGEMRTLFSPLSSNVKIWPRQFHNFCGHLKEGVQNKKYKICPYPWTAFVSTWDGNVVACNRDTSGRTVLGNVFDDSIETIWFGEKYQEFRKNHVNRWPEKNASCRECDLPYSGESERWSYKYVFSTLARRS